MSDHATTSETPKEGGQLATTAQIAFIAEKIKVMLVYFEGERAESKRATKFMTGAAITGGCLVTVLIGIRALPLPEVYATPLSVFTLILSATLTGLNSWEAFLGHRGKWVQYRTALSTLRTIQDEFNFRVGSGGMLVKDVGICFDQLMLLVQETNQAWMNVRSPVVRGTSTQEEKKVPE